MVKLFRRRYLLFKLVSKSNCSKEKIMEALYKAIINQDIKQTSNIRYIRIIDYDAANGFGIIRCNNKLVDLLRSSFINMPKFSLDITDAEVFGVSGTIRALKQKFKYSKE